MKNQLVYDLPQRLFHGLFAVLFISAFAIAKTIDDDSPLFSYHMLAGLILVFTVLLRILWGFVGPKYSRFSSFALRPKELVDYFLGILSGSKRKWVGHNPASSWATLSMFGLALGLGLTGYLMASGGNETYEDIHELMANGFLVVVLLHVAGVVLHGFRHQDGLAMSMVNGEKSDISKTEAIASSRQGLALLFVILVLTFGTYLVFSFDSQARTLDLFGTSLQLGESESEGDGGDKSSESKSEQSEDAEDEED